MNEKIKQKHKVHCANETSLTENKGLIWADELDAAAVLP